MNWSDLMWGTIPLEFWVIARLNIKVFLTFPGFTIMLRSKIWRNENSPSKSLYIDIIRTLPFCTQSIFESSNEIYRYYFDFTKLTIRIIWCRMSTYRRQLFDFLLPRIKFKRVSCVAGHSLFLRISTTFVVSIIFTNDVESIIQFGIQNVETREWLYS